MRRAPEENDREAKGEVRCSDQGLADARAEAASWRKMHESQAAIKELNKLRKDMAQAAASTNEAIRRLTYISL